MATLELTLLAEHLDPEEIAAVRAALSDTGAAPLDEDDTAEPVIIDTEIDDHFFDDFRDRLEANDASADIYLPTDFEDVIDVSEYRVGSAHALLLVLESLREDFLIEDDTADTEEEAPQEDFESFEEDEEEEDDDGMFGDEDTGTELKDDQLRHIWRQLHRGAKLAIRQGLCMFLR